MPRSQFVPKDPKAVSRGEKSAKARKVKPQGSEETPMKKETQGSLPTVSAPVEVDPLPVVANGAFAIVDSTSGKKICYETSHIPAEELKSLKRKLVNADEFLVEATQARKRLKQGVFNSALSEVELTALDLEANAKLFPEISNRDTDLRKRPLREHERATKDGRFIKPDKLMSGETANTTSLQAMTTIRTRREISDQLRDKAKWFRDIEKAATKQAEAYEAAATEVTNSITDDDKDKDESLIFIPTSGLEAVLNEEIPRLRTFSRDEWRSRQNALLSHVHALAENYRQELAGLALYVNKAIKTLDRSNTSAATLLWHLSQHKVPNLDLDAWTITEASEDSHRCECAVCQGRAAAEEFGPIGLLRKESEKTKEETIEARTALLKETEWETAITAENTEHAEETTISTQVNLLEEKWNRWFSERAQTIENDHLAFLKSMGEKKAHIEWEMDAKKDELELYENELERIEDEPLRPCDPNQITQLYEAINQCRSEITEDKKIRDAGLDIDEFVELYAIPIEKREGWLAERCERNRDTPRESVMLREARKSLQLPSKSSSVEWKLPEELQVLYEELPVSNIQKMDHYYPLFENKRFSIPFDFRSNEIWGESISGEV